MSEHALKAHCCPFSKESWPCTLKWTAIFSTTFATDEIIAKAEEDIINYKQSKDLNAVDYTQSRWKKTCIVFLYTMSTNKKNLDWKPMVVYPPK